MSTLFLQIQTGTEAVIAEEPTEKTMSILEVINLERQDQCPTPQRHIRRTTIHFSRRCTAHDSDRAFRSVIEPGTAAMHVIFKRHPGAD